jgi:hypothetical protein
MRDTRQEEGRCFGAKAASFFVSAEQTIARALAKPFLPLFRTVRDDTRHIGCTELPRNAPAFRRAIIPVAPEIALNNHLPVAK